MRLWNSCTKSSKTYNVISRVKVGGLYPADKASVFSTSLERIDRVIRRERQLRTTWDFRVRSACIPNVTRVPLRREYHKLVCWQYQFRNSVCAIYRTCSPRIAGTSNVPFRVSNGADQNHNLSVSIARMWIRHRNHYCEIECWRNFHERSMRGKMKMQNKSRKDKPEDRATRACAR